MSPAIERILAEISHLTPAEQEELRRFLSLGAAAAARPSAALINEIKGKYAFVPTSSDAFAARKREEIDLEV